jgi:hypothetical protein
MVRRFENVFFRRDWKIGRHRCEMGDKAFEVLAVHVNLLTFCI